MASQQQPRPWFRLASMMRPPAPSPAPPPPPPPARPTTALQPPAFRPPPPAQLPARLPITSTPNRSPPTSNNPIIPANNYSSSLPQSPVMLPRDFSQLVVSRPPNPSPLISTPPSPARNSPPLVNRPPSPAHNSPPVVNRPPSPAPPLANSPPSPAPNSPPPLTASGRGVTPPPPSPSHWFHPPSPLSLPPPADLKPQDDHLLEPIPAEAHQKTVLTHNTTSSANNHHSHHHHTNNKHHAFRKAAGGGDRFGMSIVTLTGDNKGAVMEVITGSTKRPTTENDNEADAFVNSNVQAVNNSILYNCAHTNRDPGVHLSVSRRHR